TGKYPLITTWLNGTKVMVLDSAVYKGRYRKDITQITFNKENIDGILGSQGLIAFQVHPGRRMAGKVRYKNILIREIIPISDSAL
ncbi:MAG: hypothetical protein HRT88_18635, partial [Lentisphaeraceae bacterium]|nr:hypothetical protein [Lentisphaeraceae bacterium]